MKRSDLILQMLYIDRTEKQTIPCNKDDDDDLPSSPSFIENIPPLLDRESQQKNPINEKSHDAVECNTLNDVESNNEDVRSEGPRRSSTSSSSNSSSSSSSSSTSASSVSRRGTIHVRSTITKNVVNYHVSPVNSDESDVDLSDTDPTFRIENSSILPNRRISNTSSSSANECVVETTDKTKTRKRKRNPNNWKQNKAKMLRNSGKSYISLSKSKKVFADRCMKQTCTIKCRLKCFENITEDERTVLFRHYWGLASLDLQRAYISSCLLEVQPKYKYTNAEKPRLPNNAFFFTVNGNRVRVCKLFFINTLGITDRQIRTVKMKCNTQGFVESERRGKHGNHKRVDPELLEYIKKHIESIPRIESHYLRASTSKEFISDSKTIKDLWNDFNQNQTANNLPACDYWLYLNTFNTEFNIGFFQPRKDRCETCVAYELAPAATKLLLKAEYDRHLQEKDLCRQEKREDRRLIDETHFCAVFDLQSVMLCPSPAYFYYSSKINCLDFTIAELKTGEDERKSMYGDVHCYFWDETQGQRGANEIGSCIFDYLGNLSRKYTDKKLHVTFYSDNCTGQNKNKVIATLYSYAVVFFPNIESIIQKYLIKGHTQNEADNVHSLIEKEIKKNEKAGPIYTPAQYATLIKSARKSGNPFIVKEVTYDFFLNIKQLQEQWGYNFNENTDKMSLQWKDLKVLKFVKDEMFSFYYKTSYTDESFSVINMRNKRKKMLSFEEISVACLYNHPLKIKENKKKDLNDLVKKQLIPSYYYSFYNSL